MTEIETPQGIECIVITRRIEGNNSNDVGAYETWITQKFNFKGRLLATTEDNSDKANRTHENICKLVLKHGYNVKVVFDKETSSWIVNDKEIVKKDK